jgi:hypothetical protein
LLAAAATLEEGDAVTNAELDVEAAGEVALPAVQPLKTIGRSTAPTATRRR